MNEALRRTLAEAGDCEIRFDDLSRQLYATDASIYQIVPEGVAFPRTAQQAAAAIRAAADHGLNLVPRGAGTGLAGGAVGDGLVIDFARYNRQISEFNREARTVRVGAGVVLDQLNNYLLPHGLWFGPDVATSSRATLGGMIANNSSGAHTPIYGTTIDHVLALEIVLADGTITTVGRGHDSLPDQRTALDQLVDRHADEIRRRMPAGQINKRWPGYGFDYYLANKGDLSKIIGGSEGTLAGIVSAVLNLVPVPPKKRVGVIFFDSVSEAMQATVELLDIKPVAIEHIDRLLFDQTKGQIAFKQARALMQLDERPCEAMLLVEFFDTDAEEKLNELAKRDIGTRKLIPASDREQLLIWSVRKQGLSLLTACAGEAKPTPGLEDVAVPARKIPEYVESLRKIFESRGIMASYYGHAASGLLHVRPKLNLHTAKDIKIYRELAEEVSALCLQFKGSLAGEHGVGIARTEFMPEHLGPDLNAACAEVKRLFDPKKMMNPGKIVPGKGYRIDTNLRYGDLYKIVPPFEGVYGFIERDGSFVGNLEQCNGCGDCRKNPPTMCPTYQATGEEIMVTRGRANTIRATLDGRLGEGDPLRSPDLAKALDYCLSCKACKTECPSNVDMTLLKAELVHARQKRDGIPLVDRVISNSDLLGKLGTAFYPLSNWALKMPVTGWIMNKMMGFTRERPMPLYAAQRFDRWFKKRSAANGHAVSRGKVILWDDTWVRYNEPNIGRAAVRVLEAAGFAVGLAEQRKCCGRPACSRGVLDEVQRLGRHNVEMFNALGGEEPIIFLEPSCYSMFVDEYVQMKIPGAEKVARRCVLFEHFVYELLRREPDALPFRKDGPVRVAIHGHCHSKALTDANVFPALAGMVPQADVRMLKTGCCGMAGAFGMMADKYELSKDVAKPLVEQIKALEPGTHMVASGTSCRHQITHLTKAEPLHMAELLAMALGNNDVT
ncbi:MAG: FAD-binding protein [Phycisphaerales bacterium]|nr:FAD-binding protein [Phycisphaerales bacterium]